MTTGHEDEPLGKLIGQTGRSIARTHNRILKESGFSLSFEKSLLIHWLSFHPGVAQQHVRHCLDRDKARIARVLNSLEKQGLIRRETDSEDRRIKRVFLTPEGMEQERALAAIRSKTMAVSTREIPPDELRICRKTLKKIIRNLEMGNKREDAPVQSLMDPQIGKDKQGKHEY